MTPEQAFLEDGRLHRPMMEALRDATRHVTHDDGFCDLVAPYICRTPEGETFCLGCFYLGAWGDGRGTP
jgi:hypothetical protein